MGFKWHPNEDPPLIEGHSKAKLEVLRKYLYAYFDRLNVNVQRDEFKLDLVDGFAGGGIFRDNDGNTLPGSPLIMLKEIEEAKDRLNEDRKKPLDIDCKCYFIDKAQSHIDHLKKTLDERGYEVNDDKIVVRTGQFNDELDGIINDINKRQPRAGRAIFLLDQTGYARVNLELVSRIMKELPAAEVILTFAADALINFINQKTDWWKPLASNGWSNSQIKELATHKNHERALVQRTLREQIRAITGAPFDTPFFIRPEISRRALWFIHLSKHPTARNVMLQLHWDIPNTFEHYGSGDFDMLGWDALRPPDKQLPLFNFEQIHHDQMMEQLLNTMPSHLFALASERSVTVETVLHTFANRIAATHSDLNEIICRLRDEGEINILAHDGTPRTRRLQQPELTDRIALPNTLFLPGFSRGHSLPKPNKEPREEKKKND